MSSERLKLGEELPVIHLPSLCPGKDIRRPEVAREGLGILADIEHSNRLSGLDALEVATGARCDTDCDGPVKEPRKVLGITIGEKEVCRQGYQKRHGIVLS